MNNKKLDIYTVWYYTEYDETWNPNDFNTELEALEFVKTLDYENIRVTKEINFSK